MSPVTQTARIQLRRGTYAELPLLAIGELGWTTDTQQLFIGNGTNNVLVAGAGAGGGGGGGGGGGTGLPVLTATLADGQSIIQSTGLSSPSANIGGIINYTINRAGIGRAGVFTYAVAGLNSVAWDDEFSGANVGIDLSASLINSGSQVSLNYTSTSTGNTAVINATINSL